MRYLLLILMLVGCTPTTKEVTQDYKIPDDLKDCIFHHLRNDKGVGIVVVRCPNSTTSAKRDKATTITVDGIEYERKDRK